jgi:hypothetical protein
MWHTTGQRGVRCVPYCGAAALHFRPGCIELLSSQSRLFQRSGVGDDLNFAIFPFYPSVRHVSDCPKRTPCSESPSRNHLFNISEMDDVPFQNTPPTASSLTRDISYEEAMPSLLSRNMTLSKKDWEDLKSTIRELYLDQGQTLKQLAKYLEEHYRFKPT